MEGLLGKSIGAFLSHPRQQEPEEIIQTLCNRLQHSTNLEDRRAAVLGLRGFSRDYQAVRRSRVCGCV
jgi:intracellular protein transport protein USO1